MQLPEHIEDMLNTAFVVGLTIFIIAFWLIVIPA